MKFNPASDNLYQRLGISQNASQEEIKNVFFLAVKKYPPEKNPQNYKLIREAYDILRNPVSRNEYDSKQQFGKELERILADIEYERKNNNFDKAIKLYKKVINIAPSVGIYRNQLGLLHMDSSAYKLAISQFEKAHKIDPNNSSYLLNLASAEEENRNYRKAEEHIKKAWALDEQDYAPPRALATLYFYKMNEKQKAYETLDKAISADGKIDFHDFFCIYDKIYFLLHEKKEKELEGHLDLLVRITQKEEEKRFVSFTLSKSCTQLAEMGVFKLAVKFSKAAVQMSDEEWIAKIDKELKEYVAFEQDKEIAQEVKAIVSLCYYRYWRAISEEDFDKYFKNVQNNFYIALSTKSISHSVKQSFIRVKDRYPITYNLQKKYYDSLLSQTPSECYYSGPCPYCSEVVRSSLYQTGNYTCPHCSKVIVFNGESYTVPSLLRKWFGRFVIGGIILWVIIASSMEGTSTTSRSSTRTPSSSYSNYSYLPQLKKTIENQEAQIRLKDAYLSTLENQITQMQSAWSNSYNVPSHVVNNHNSKVDAYKRLLRERQQLYDSYSANINRYNSSINK